jgi:hypothetical protein
MRSFVFVFVALALAACAQVKSSDCESSACTSGSTDGGARHTDLGAKHDGGPAGDAAPSDFAAAAPDDLAPPLQPPDFSPTSDFAAAPDLTSADSCLHSMCLSGVKLVDGCNPCVTQICAVDNYCCVTKWSYICVNEVASICGLTCS